MADPARARARFQSRPPWWKHYRAKHPRDRVYFGKRLELLKETFPKITRVAHFRDATLLQGKSGSGKKCKSNSPSTWVCKLQSLDGADRVKDFDGAFEAILMELGLALTTTANPAISINQQRIVAFAAKLTGCQRSIHTTRLSKRSVECSTE